MTNYRPIIDAILDGHTDQAVLMLIKLERRERKRDENFANDDPEAPWNKNLPPMVKARSRRPRPLEHKCPTCGAKPGQPCIKTSNRGAGDNPVGQPLQQGKSHKARRVLAGGK